MKVTEITVENFKSFKSLHLKLNNFTVLVGANAAGKSNTITILRFIQNIVAYGLENAISLLGGMEYTVNATIGKAKPIHIAFVLDVSNDNWRRIVDRKLGHELKLEEIKCDFKILPNKRGQGYKIIKDHLEAIHTSVIVNFSKPKSSLERVKSNNGKYVIILDREKNKIISNDKNETEFEISKLKSRLGIDFIVGFMNDDLKKHKDELMLHKIEFFTPPAFYSEKFIKIYNFDPNLLKKSCSLTSMTTLQEDGSNLAIILREILKNQVSKNKLLNLLQDCLPFIDQISTQNNVDESTSYIIREKYSRKNFHANFMSDGTVNILALIVAFYFEKNGIIIIEEPERNLHPQLMSKIIEMAEDVSSKRQVILTTHNPELLKYSELRSLLFASRCKEGFTSIVYPINSTSVKEFLKSDLGIEDLFLQNMLGD